MKISESIVNNFLFEIESLSYRLKNIRECYKSSSNEKLKDRLIYENNKIFERLIEINKIANFLNKKNIEKICYTTLLIEKTKRILEEAKTESYLFFLKSLSIKSIADG